MQCLDNDRDGATCVFIAARLNLFVLLMTVTFSSISCNTVTSLWHSVTSLRHNLVYMRWRLGAADGVIVAMIMSGVM